MGRAGSGCVAYLFDDVVAEHPADHVAAVAGTREDSLVLVEVWQLLEVGDEIHEILVWSAAPLPVDP